MAAVMRNMTGPYATLLEALIGALGGPYGNVVAVATALAASSASQTEVLYAADHGMRVHVVIKDKVPHTSYSIRFAN